MVLGTGAGATGVAVVEMAGAGRFAEIERLFAPRLRALIDAEAVRVAWATEVGVVTAVGEPVSEPAGAGLVQVSVAVECERRTRAVVATTR